MSAPVIRQVATFLFCDQVGSTALLEQLGEASSDELRHDLFATLRRPIDASGFGFVPVSDATPAISSSTSSTGPDDDQTLPPPWGLASSPSPDGGVRVADVSDTLIHWSDGGEQPSGYLDPGLGYLWALALAPDGRTAIVEADAGFALVALDGRSSLERSSVPLGDASFTSYVMPSVSPDGSRLALLTGPVETMTSRVVDLASGEPVGPSVRGRAGFVDDRTLVAGSFDPNGLLLRRLDVATDAPAGETLITGFTPTELASEDAATGRVMLTGTFDGSPSEVAVLVTQNPTAQWRVIEELDGVDELALRPGHDEAWAVRAGGLVRIDLARLTVEPVPIAGSGLGQLAFSGDGTTLFVTVDDRVLSLDVSRSELAAPTLIARLPSAALQMSADTIGARVAVNLDGGPVLLDVASGEAFTVGQSFARQVAFLPSGDLLVIDDFAAKVVGFDHDLLASVACRVAGRVQTPEEWERYGPEDAPYAPTCAA